jgi:VCBS repeat-containing protein
LIDDVENGTLNLNSNGGFDYTPDTNYFGTDTFTYQAYDGNQYSNTATVTITIIGTNDPPTANDDNYTTPEETILTITAPGILENDTDPDYETLTALLVDSVSNGTLTFKSNGSFIYNPENGFNGEDSFTYRAYDGTVVSNIATVSINVTPVNDPPVAYADYYITNEDITLIISENGILDNDTDPENDILTASLVTNVTNGILNLYSNGTFEYTPNTNYFGSDQFTYRAFDGLEYSNSATVTITINPINDPPIANDDYNTTEEDTTLIIPSPGIMANDSDVENDPLTAILVSNVTHGTLTLYENGSIIYTPENDYIGPDSFTYKINDGSNDSNTATVYLTVYPLNDPPVANDDNYSVNEDTTLNVAAPGILANDTDPENDPLIAILVSDVSYGILNLNMNGAFDYTPNQNYNGIDSFTYQAYDGMEYSNIATVTITINPVNDPPVANNDYYTTEEDTTLNVPAPGVLTNDTDPENDPLTAIKITNSTNGTITTFNSDGSFTYIPDNDYVGTDTFTYQAYDSLEYSNTATVTITITQANDPPTANDDSYTTDEDTTLIVTAPGILINDTDPENDTLTSTLVSDVTHGELTFNENGSFIYNPDGEFFGSDSFTYRAYDGELVSNIGIVNITINPVNDQPVANDDYYSTDEDTTLNVASPGVLANDSDVENDPLTASLVSDVTNGILNLNSNGSFDYTSDTDYYGTDSFTYQAYDGLEYSNTATVTITIDPVNDPPIANDDNESVTEDSIDNQLDVLLNDNDVDGDILNIINVTTPSHGNVTYNNDYVFYTPDQDYNGPDDFIYTITDNNGETDTAVVNITVTPQNDPPYTPSNPSPSDGQLDVDINANISWIGGDVDGDPVTYDVYFGLINPPQKIISNQTDTYYIPGTMNFTKDYYWKIVAWDNQGSSTTGPIWNFTTEGEYDWEAILTFEETDGETDNVYFGEKLTASDNQDTWDTPKDPSGSPPYIRAWFNTNFTDPYDELWKEYKHSPDDNKLWNLTVRWAPLDNSSSTEITITWNPSNFDNSEYNNIFFVNNLTQESINMFVQNSYTFNASALNYYQFKIICNNKLIITGLKSKWNIISTPFNQSVSKSDIIVKYNGTEYTWQNAVNNNIVLGFIYTWIRNAPQHYELINNLKPGYGYWVYAYQPCTLLIDGASTKNNDGFITNMLTTWNIVGLPNIEKLPKQDLYVRYNGEFYSWVNATTNNNPTGGPIILGFIYNWSRSPPQNYELTNTFNPGYGYQMYAYYNCSIYYFVTGPLAVLPISDNNNLDKITSSENQIYVNDNNDIYEEWNIKLEFNELGGSNDYVFFGERTNSLDAIDCFDVPKNPSGISPYIHVYFEESNSEPFDKLWRSYKKYPDKNKCWNLAVQWVPSDLNLKTTLTISWDKNSFNNCYYKSVALYDKEKNIKLVDMLINEEYTFTCPALTVQRFTIKCYSNQSLITPNNPNPYNDAIDIKTKLNLNWSGGEPDLGDKINIKYPNQKLLIKTMTFNEIN